MADERTPVIPVPEKGPKVWKYVGPGSEERKNERIPLISNLPLEIKIPRLGTDSTKYPANELPQKYVEYVMRTNTAAKDWWK
jgi:hypothetical protein